MDQTSIEKLRERFLRYVRIDTQSDESSQQAPSTAKQLNLLRLLEQELTDMGAEDVHLTGYGCVLATVLATVPADDLPTIAFLAHVDTVPQISGTGVKPIVHSNYDGDSITLPDDPTKVLTPESSPALKTKIGHDVITTSGTTLLGADDKAGVAIIMTMVSELTKDHRIPHGDIRICFTPDEEIGRGVEHLTAEDLAADYAYTLDGGDVGEITYESFSADKAVVEIEGVSIHPGTAKGKMVNALTLAAKFVTALPEYARTPETTDGREGFIHLYTMSGSAAKAQLNFILRDFELDGLAAHGEVVRKVAQALQAAEPRAKITCTVTPQYRNMRYWLENDMEPVDLAIKAIEEAGVEPVIEPIRGGTDGSRLTEKGVPTPNLFAGMQNVHSETEWVSVQDMAKAADVCINLVQLWARRH